MQLGSDERRHRIALAFLSRDFIYNKSLLLCFSNNLAGLRVVADQDFTFLQILIEAARLYGLFANLQQTRVESGRYVAGKVRGDRPVLGLHKRFDFAFAFDDHAQRHGLHATGAQTPADRATKQRRNFVTDQTIENAARLLRIDQVRIDLFRMFERFLHGALGDLIEHHAKRGRGWFLRDDFFGKMLADRLAFPIRISGQINCFDFLCSLL